MVGRKPFLNALAILLALSAWTAVTAGAQSSGSLRGEDGPLSIRWEAVSGAAAYRIEVRRDGQSFISTETENTEIKLNLAPGPYEYRIGVLNPFGGAVSDSGWIPLRVERARVPYFRVKAPSALWEGDPDIEIVIESSVLSPEVEFFLVRGDRKLPVETVPSETERLVRVPVAELTPGEWDLEAKDPSGKVFVHPDAVQVRPTRPPEIVELDTVELAGEGLVPVTISGDAFDKDMRVSFKGPGGYLNVAALEVTDGREAKAFLDLEGAEPGVYELILTNPAGMESRLETAVTVAEPVMVEKPKTQPRFELQMGWAPTVINIPGSDDTLPAIPAFEIAATVHSGWTTPFARGLGVEARGFAGVSGPLSAPNGGDFHFIGSMDISGYWRPLVRGKIAPVWILGIGNMWSDYAAAFGIENLLFVRLGFALDFADYSRLTRFGITYLSGFDEDGSIPMISLMFRRGFRM
ncbi:MAG: hypothetical protein P1P77_00385 [Spirochaetaceae bacterium]|nr:hypothetical protein [Spirochaetaceae bacterium]